MKKTIMTLALVVITISSYAQIGSYYRTIHNKEELNIVRSDSTLIAIEEKSERIWYYFTEGVCNEIYIDFNTDKKTIENRLSRDSTLTKSKLGDWYYYYSTGKDNLTFHCIVEIWNDKEENRPYMHIFRNELVTDK